MIIFMGLFGGILSIMLGWWSQELSLKGKYELLSLGMISTFFYL